MGNYIKPVNKQELLGGLNPRQVTFITYYMLSGNSQLASEIAGYSPSYGYTLRNEEGPVRDAIDALMLQKLQQAEINGDWIARRLVENDDYARLTGKLSDSNKALDQLARLSHIDAYASSKMDVVAASDEDMVAKIREGRARASRAAEPVATVARTVTAPDPDYADNDDTDDTGGMSFL